ncbi:RICIN domain-containing protein [Streptomyces sp. NBC_00286]|uniref:RICIN domain-containing protein n=1 Tax=Streptomyces sp. NBC_00286 TaxID=2975701 RepID=UPI002E2D3B3C|nr:RICIN domain-containing protein [Streptomyces sp. NBC_00286]
MDRGDESDEYDTEADGGAQIPQHPMPPEQEELSSVSDERLTDLLRADARTARPAWRELRSRHRPAVLSYARLCTVDESAAHRITATAFTLAARETARGIEPPTPWRHQLLLLACRVAAEWSADERGARLDPGLLVALREADAGAEGPVPPMLAAFLTLPARVQGLVWYGVVDGESEADTARFLGVAPEDVAYGMQGAFHDLCQSVLTTRLAGSDDPDCQDFHRLIEEAVRPERPRRSADLDAHMGGCPHCATGYEELAALRDTPRAALAEGLLPWGGAAYAMSGGAVDEARQEVRTAAGQGERSAARWSWSAWWPSRRVAIVSAALGVALAPLLVYALTQGDSGSQESAGAVDTPTRPPSATVTSTFSPPPTLSATAQSPSPEPTKPTRSASPSPKPTPTPTPTTTPTRSKPPAPGPPDGTFAQVVNVDSGQCLDVEGGDFDLGTDVIAADCSASRSQRWRVDADTGAIQSFADPDFCLDSRGSVDDGLGIWTCESLDSDNGENLRFAVDGTGVIRPVIAPDHAVTPAGGEDLDIEPEDGDDDQRWRAGAGIA